MTTVFVGKTPAEQMPCACASVRMLPSSSHLSPSTSWIPLHELTKQWATFGQAADCAPALTATGEAFAALSWEMTALRHRSKAWRVLHAGRCAAAAKPFACTLACLRCAERAWSRARGCLERLAQHRVWCSSEQEREPARAMIHVVVAQQQRLQELIRVTEHERVTSVVAPEPAEAKRLHTMTLVAGEKGARDV